MKAKLDPFGPLVNRRKESIPEEEAVRNATVCRKRARAIVKKFSGPEVLHYYLDLIATANAITVSRKIAPT